MEGFGRNLALNMPTTPTKKINMITYFKNITIRFKGIVRNFCMGGQVTTQPPPPPTYTHLY